MPNPTHLPLRAASHYSSSPVLNRLSAPVSNGHARVGDLVRELPATHIQPCACCLCRPPGGERPALRIYGIAQRDGVLYLRLDDDYECPADELELVYRQ